MRKFIGFGVLLLMLALTMLVWAKSGNVTATDVGSSASIPPHEMMLNPKGLPVQQLDSLY